MLLRDLVDDRVPLAALLRVDEVRVVGADHLAVGRDDDDLEVVDLRELLRLGLGRTGHAGQLVVHAEVVLERDRGEGPLLVADRRALLGLDRLVEPLRPAPPGHEATGELVDDDHLAVLDDVVAVALVEDLRLQRLLEVAGQAEVALEHVVDAEHPLHLVGAGLGDGDLLELLVDDVVLLRGQARNEARELEVLVGRLLGVAADDERRARLVDEDVVDLVHDREEVAALRAALEVDDEVVAQEVEAELVVRAVRDVRGVGLAPRDGPQVAQALIGRVMVRVEQERGVVLDRSDAHPEPMEDGADPLRVALGEVVVRR